jgi:hypothetical protein
MIFWILNLLPYPKVSDPTGRTVQGYRIPTVYWIYIPLFNNATVDTVYVTLHTVIFGIVKLLLLL